MNGMADRSKKDTGDLGEQKAIQYLIDSNYQILKTNFRVGRIGEIDIIARDGEYICFVEVKTRKTTSFGYPSEAVDSVKQHRINQVAAIYLSNMGLSDQCSRFDIIEVFINRQKDKEEIKSINHLKNAF